MHKLPNINYEKYIFYNKENSTDRRWIEPYYCQKVAILGRLSALFIKLLCSTLKLHLPNFEINKFLSKQSKPIIYLVWHGSQLVPTYVYRNKGIYIMTSYSRDGDIQTQSLYCLGYKIIRGSSSKGGSRALLQLVKLLSKPSIKNTFNSASITLDGPRGPWHIPKPGIVLLAQKTSAMLLPLAVAYTRVYRLNNWDKFEIPIPFSKVVMYTGMPFTLDSSISVDEGLKIICHQMNCAYENAKNYL